MLINDIDVCGQQRNNWFLPWRVNTFYKFVIAASLLEVEFSFMMREKLSSFFLLKNSR